MGRHINLDKLPADIQSFVFPGGEPHIILDNPESWTGEVTIDARVRTWRDWGKLLFLLDALKQAQVVHEGGQEIKLYLADGTEWGSTEEDNQIRLYLPYFPGARMDRVEHANMPFSLDIYADQLASVLVDTSNEVHVLDMHSDIGMNLLQVHLDSVIFSLYEELDYSVFGDVKYDAVIAPDKGAVARASTFIQYMPDDWDDVFMWVGDKQRDFDTGKITGYVLDCEQEDFFNPYRVLVVDDICDGGATFNILAEHFGEDWEVDLFVTHGLFSKGVDAISPRYQRLYTTDSHWFNWTCPRITRVPAGVFDLKEST